MGSEMCIRDRVKVVTADGSVERYQVNHGFLYYSDNTLVVLADHAEPATDA